MGLFDKKEDKNYIVVDAYNGDVLTTCVTKELKQISQVQVTVKFIECTEYEAFKFKEHGKAPDDLTKRKAYSFKEIK